MFPLSPELFQSRTTLVVCCDRITNKKSSSLHKNFRFYLGTRALTPWCHPDSSNYNLGLKHSLGYCICGSHPLDPTCSKSELSSVHNLQSAFGNLFLPGLHRHRLAHRKRKFPTILLRRLRYEFLTVSSIMQTVFRCQVSVLADHIGNTGLMKKCLNVNFLLTDAASHQTLQAIADCALIKTRDQSEPLQLRAMFAGITILYPLTA